MKAIGRYDFELLDKSGIVIATRSCPNLVVTEGANHLWDVALGGVTPVDPWYVGLINSTPTPSIVAGDTLASHGGWVELVPATDYTGNRQAFVDAASTARTKTASSNAVFPILTTKTIYGACLVSVATTDIGVLFSAGAFSSPLPVINGNTVNVIYSVQLT